MREERIFNAGCLLGIAIVLVSLAVYRHVQESACPDYTTQEQPHD